MKKISKSSSKRTSRACNCCRRKKIKCNGMLPCINCINYKTVCIYDSETSKSRQNYKTPSIVSKLLSNLSKIGEGDIKNNQSLFSGLDTLNTLLEQSIDKARYKEEDHSPSLSKETLVSKNFRKNRFSKTANGYCIVNSFFGLYSSVSLFSGPGLAWFTDTTMKHNSVYDLNIFSEKELKNSMHSQFMKNLENFEKLNVIWSEFLSLNDVLGFELDEKKFSYLIQKHYSDPNIKCYVSQSVLTSMVNDFFKDRQSCFLQRKFLVLFSFIVSALPLSSSLDQKLQTDCLRICIFIFKRSMFSVKNNIEFLIGLLQLLSCGELKLFPEWFESILAEAIEYAFKLGFNRKELYVGLAETDADLRRSIMWDLYVLDKKNYLFQSRRMYIYDDDISCLYPNSMEAIISIPPQSITTIMQENQLSNYIEYYQIKLAKIVYKIHNEFLSANSSLKLANAETLDKILTEFECLRGSMVLELMPGSKIMKDTFSKQDFWKISSFHLLFFTYILFLISSLKTLPDRKKPQYSVYFHKATGYAMLILQLFLDVKDNNEQQVLPEICGPAVVSAFVLIEKITQSPLDAETPRIIEILLKFRKQLANFSSRSWNHFGQFIDLFLAPTTKIFRELYKDGISNELAKLIDDLLQEIPTADEVQNNPEACGLNNKIENFKEIDFHDHFLSIFESTDPFFFLQPGFEG